MASLTLLRQRHALAEPAEQLRILHEPGLPRFAERMEAAGQEELTASGIEVLQVNVGKVCNQTCRHCHVDAGPDRREQMTLETMEYCLRAIRQANISVLDITGGAPEMNPHFRWLVTEGRQLGCQVIDRCNLTILLAPGYEDLPRFLAEHEVEIVASLPCYSAANTDAQRGDGVFQRSIRALQILNELGYGQPGSGRVLTLVYNPIGPSLPPMQAGLEIAYRQQLHENFGIRFNRLYTITNMPISRFLEDLVRQGEFESYLQKLIESYNPASVPGLMCRNTISVGWDGRLYDCDFNQMLDLDVAAELPRHIRDFDAQALRHRKIVTDQHCFGCTAGSGSGCQGAIVG